jgi:hypothetical protein
MQPPQGAFIIQPMNESKFTTKFNKGLPEDIHIWKISDRFSKGVPDCYYSGSSGDLWIEYKYEKNGLAKQKKRAEYYPNLSMLQKIWLESRYKQGRNVAVITFLEGYGVAINHGENLLGPIDHSKILTIDEARNFVTEQVCKKQ